MSVYHVVCNNDTGGLYKLYFNDVRQAFVTCTQLAINGDCGCIETQDGWLFIEYVDGQLVFEGLAVEDGHAITVRLPSIPEHPLARSITDFAPNEIAEIMGTTDSIPT